ncbi:hypothetical protein [Pseudorhodobacter antarcticus]|nr:hypothetical protein [Pseudorhodobacter antarcticus]
MTASAALIAVGAGFLTLAAWIYLAATQSALFAAGVIGLVYLGAGAVMLGLAARTPPAPHTAPPDALGGFSPMQLVLVSFLQGMDQGKKANHRQ